MAAPRPRKSAATRRPAFRESAAARRQRAEEIVRRLGEMYPDSECSLTHANPFQLLVATVLSAQTTDARVNQSTPELFRRWPTPAALGDAPLEQVEQVVHPLGFFRSKAKSIVGLSQALAEEHGGEVPQDLPSLTRLPGVGRKTANVVLGTAFGIAEGVVVDTHVRRVSNRLALTREDDPERIEKDLLRLLPEGARISFTHRVIDHGRAICIARRPLCEQCALADICPTGAQLLGKPATG